MKRLMDWLGEEELAENIIKFRNLGWTDLEVRYRIYLKSYKRANCFDSLVYSPPMFCSTSYYYKEETDINDYPELPKNFFDLEEDERNVLLKSAIEKCEAILFPPKTLWQKIKGKIFKNRGVYPLTFKEKDTYDWRK